MATAAMMESTTQVRLLLIFTIASISSVSCLQLSYSSIEQLNTTCSPKDTCQSQNSRSRYLLSLAERNCACDNECTFYDDCCIDFKYPTRDGTKPSTAEAESWECDQFTHYGSVFLKGSCPDHWTDEVIRQKCEAKPEVSDPLSSMPVTSGGPGLRSVTYKNSHCALCNRGADQEKHLFWGLRIQCEGLEEYNRTWANLTTEYIEQNLVFFSFEKQWGIVLKYPYFCDVDAVPPEPVVGSLRICHQNIIRDCAEDWPQKSEVREACHKYQALVYSSEANPKKFRNPHCAQCNHVNTSGLLCQPMASREVIIGRNRPLSAFAILLDMNPGSGSSSSMLVGRKKVCQDNEVYDPFFKMCRNLVCESNTHKLVNGTCIAVKSGNGKGDDDANGGIEGADRDFATTDSNLALGTTTDSTAAKNSGKDKNVTFQVSDKEDNSKRKNEIENSRTSNCAKVTLSKDSYLVLKNGSVYVTRYSRLFEPGNYTITAAGHLLVCPPFTGGAFVSKFPEFLGHLTQVGLSISIAFLILHLITFFLVPEMRNLSGRNLSSMAFCLLVGYSSFLLAQQNFVSSQKSLCVAASVSLYYFFLASFMWMNVMAFDVWRTLSLATSELRVASGRQHLRFVAYAAYAWVISGVIVSLALSLDFAPVNYLDSFRPRFAVDNKCWFTNRRALITFFALPVALIMLANIVFFGLTAFIILKTTSRAVSANSSKSSAQRNFKLYARLTVLMGLTWVTGFLASLVDDDYLWAVFIVLNTMQGVFIFVSFTCSKKIRKSLRDKFSALCDARTRAAPSTSLSAQSRSFGTGSTAVSASRSTVYSHHSTSGHNHHASLASPPKQLAVWVQR